MRNKYKKRDIGLNKPSSTLENNLNYSYAYNLKRNKSPKNSNSTAVKNMPFSNKFNKIIEQNETENIIK